MESFKNSGGGSIVANMIRAVKENAAYLSEIDGAIGDGDHGINMKKGFSLCEKELGGREVSLQEGLKTLGRVLLMEIGGSMGPLYGTIFREMARIIKDREEVDAAAFLGMLEAALAAVVALGKAKVGDKTLVDVLAPAAAAFRESLAEGEDFKTNLGKMTAAAALGRDSTKDMTAKIGRAARLGERSRGTLDAGAVSCFLILDALARGVEGLLRA